MRIIDQTWDLTANTISELPPVKRGDVFLHRLKINRDAAPFFLPDEFSMIFDAKPKGGHSGAAVILAMAYSWVAESGCYLGKVKVHSDELDEALGIAGEAEEKDSIELNGEVTYAPPVEGEEEEEWTTSPTFKVTVENDVHRGLEGVPDSTTEPVNFYTKTQSDARYVGQNPEDAWAQLNGLGITFDEERSGLNIVLPGGGAAFAPVTVVPNP